MASRCAYASLVQRDATGPAEHSTQLLLDGCGSDVCYHLTACPSSCRIVAPRCAPVQRALPEWQRWAGFTASDSSYQSPLLESISPVGHRAGLFAVARLCAFAGPLPHVSRNGSTVAAFAPRPLASEVPPSLVMSIMQITNKEMGSTFPRPHPRARHGEVCSRKGAEINNFPNSEFAIVVRRGLLFPRSGR